MSSDLSQFETLGRAPIDGPAPAGASARYEPEYEAIEAELEKLEAVAGGAVDWGTVVDNAAVILRSKSKDMLVASYMSRGLFEKSGYAGLAAGLDVLNDLCASYWEDLFPPAKREKARAAAFNWLAEKASLAVEKAGPANGASGDVDAALEALSKLTTQLEAKLNPQLVDAGALRRALADAKAAGPTPAPAPSTHTPPAATPPEAAPAASPAPPPAPSRPIASAAAPPGDITSDGELQRAVRGAQDVLRKAAAYKLAKTPSDPGAYRLLRTAVWMDVEDPPPATDGQSQVRGPAADRIQFFNEKIAAGDFETVLPELEKTLGRAPFWLTGHKMTADALGALGHSKAKAAVERAVGAFTARAPHMSDLKFADGTPFADAGTKAWIAGLGSAAQPKPAPAITPAPAAEVDGDGAPWAKAIEKARDLAEKGDEKAAAAYFVKGRESASSGRARAFWTLHQALFWMERGRIDIARRQLEDLNRILEEHHAEVWEPALSLDVASALLLCYTQEKDAKGPLGEGREAAVERLRSRICRLDPIRALEFA
ncbi:MAG: type VI secretion system protein TssA [Pseudomonadota bacterium]